VTLALIAQVSQDEAGHAGAVAEGVQGLHQAGVGAGAGDVVLSAPGAQLYILICDEPLYWSTIMLACTK